MTILSSLYQSGAKFRFAAIFLLALTATMTGGEASARCFGSDDPLVIRQEIEIGRDPSAAVGSIAEQIDRTDPANTDRLAELYLIKSIALYMSGRPRTEAVDKARSLASAFAPDHPVNMMLRLDDIYDIEDDAEKKRQLASVERDFPSLPAGSATKTCRAIDLAFYNTLLENPRKAFTFATHAYRASEGDNDTPYHAEATSMLAYLVSTAHDFKYAQRLHSEALEAQIDLGMSDLAVNELVLRAYTELADSRPRDALADFKASARKAREYGNEYAVDYALLGACQAALQAGKLGEAGPACERAYENLGKSDDRSSFPARVYMAEYLVRTDDARGALALLDPLIAGGRGIEDPETWIDALRIRASANAALGRDAQAYADSRQATEARDAFLREERRNGISAMQARFQTEELQSRLAAEERASNARLRLAIAVIVGSLTTLALLGGVGHLRPGPPPSPLNLGSTLRTSAFICFKLSWRQNK